MTTNQDKKEILAREKRDIQLFILDDFIPSKESRILISDVYLAYKSWRKRMKLPGTILALDGFGRMFPKHFERKLIRRGDVVANAVIGMAMKPRH